MLLVCQGRWLNFHTLWWFFWKYDLQVKSLEKPCKSLESFCMKNRVKSWERMRKKTSLYKARVMNKKEFQSLWNPCVASSRERKELSFPNFNRKSSISFYYLILPKNKIYLVDILLKIKSNLLTIFSKIRVWLFCKRFPLKARLSVEI